MLPSSCDAPSPPTEALRSAVGAAECAERLNRTPESFIFLNVLRVGDSVEVLLPCSVLKPGIVPEIIFM